MHRQLKLLKASQSSVIAALLLACAGSETPSGVTIDSSGTVLAQQFSPWSAAVNVESIAGTHASFNTAQLDGCPFVAPDGKTFYMASNRPGTLGGLDIWVSTRASESDPWGEPRNAGEPVNSVADDFCPTMARDGRTFYFVSRRSGGCGLGDIYVTRLRSDNGFDAPEMLPCAPMPPYEAVNSPFDEFSPFPVQDAGAGQGLYFSSFRPGGFAEEAAGGTPDSDIYFSAALEIDGPELVGGVNTAADDGQPNVSRNGLELYFYSTRAIEGALGGADLYVATRLSLFHEWTPPVNLGAAVNSAAGETRPSLSWDGTALYFGSTRSGGEGSSDIYVGTRSRIGR